MIMLISAIKKFMTAISVAVILGACSDDGPVQQPQPDDPGEIVGNLLDIPDVDGKNVKGVVYCGNTPLEGVAVSDGAEVTLTDRNGRYYLNSSKKTGYVYVSIPSGYMVGIEKKTYPLYYQKLSAATSAPEQHDFRLYEEPGEDYVIMYLADMHLANRNQDIEQYQKWFLRDISEEIGRYTSEGKKVYCMTLGDESWNTYWYASDGSASFTLTDVKPYLEKLGVPVFNVIGNHDHDPKEYLDFQSENMWRREFGPTYYSYNIGKVHFIVLDNVFYANPDGDLSGDCYQYRLTEEQIAWLRSDLATIKDKSAPIHVLTHAPLHAKPKLSGSGQPKYTYNMDDGKRIATLFAGFSNVTVFSGHTHVNYSVRDTDNPGIFEYNVAAVCATWWWSGRNGYAGNHICRDGSVGGYRVVEVSGNTTKTYYKSIGYGNEYQFRTYDCNECLINAGKYCPDIENDILAGEISSLTNASGATGTEGSNWHSPNLNNEVLINVFAYGPGWTVEATENGRKLDVKRENAFDPLNIISTMCYRLENGGSISDTFRPSLSSHFFRVQASSPTSTLEIKVTDPDGTVYRETMTRPKALSASMR